MWRRFLLASLLFLLPANAWAQDAAEKLLPGGSQIYLRWDGVEAHRAAYEKSALGKMMKEDTGKFLAAIWDYGIDILDKTIGERDPNAARGIAFLKEVPGIMGDIGRNGFVFAAELKSINPPMVETYLIFPGSGGEKGSLLPFIKKITEAAGAPVQQNKVGNRAVSHLAGGPVHLGWWNEGDNDAVIVVGTEDPDAVAKAMGDAKDSLATTTRFKSLKGFKEFATWGRGYIDLPEFVKLGANISPEIGQLLDDIGLKSLGAITFQSGFDGLAERSVVEVDITGPRKGVLALLSKKTIKLADLPALPDDVTSFSASSFNLGSYYEAGLQIAEGVVRMFAPDQAGNVKEMVKQFEALIGIKLGEDLFSNFGDMSVSYNSSAEGPLTFGGVYLFKVKDEKKINDTLQNVFDAFKNFPGGEVVVKRTKYHGGEILDLRMKSDFFEVPIATMSVHKGWFLLSNIPQPIQGFILREKGELPAWKASPEITKALTPFPKEFTSISVSDPRPGVKFLLSVAPTAFMLANSFLPQAVPNMPSFDVGLIPHAQYAVRHLFPNVTVTTDNGKKMRIETRASLALPF